MAKLFVRADQSHRIPSHQPDQLIEQHLHHTYYITPVQSNFSCKKLIRIKLEYYTALHTVFYVCVVRSIGQVDDMEFDEIGQPQIYDH